MVTGEQLNNEVAELMTQLSFLCDGKDNRVIGVAVKGFLRQANMELVNRDVLNLLRKKAHSLDLLREQITGSMDGLMNELDDMRENLEARIKTFKRLQSTLNEGMKE